MVCTCVVYVYVFVCCFNHRLVSETLCQDGVLLRDSVSSELWRCAVKSNLSCRSTPLWVTQGLCFETHRAHRFICCTPSRSRLCRFAPLVSVLCMSVLCESALCVSVLMNRTALDRAIPVLGASKWSCSMLINSFIVRLHRMKLTRTRNKKYIISLICLFVL